MARLILPEGSSAEPQTDLAIQASPSIMSPDSQFSHLSDPVFQSHLITFCSMKQWANILPHFFSGLLSFSYCTLISEEKVVGACCMLYSNVRISESVNFPWMPFPSRGPEKGPESVFLLCHPGSTCSSCSLLKDADSASHLMVLVNRQVF